MSEQYNNSGIAGSGEARWQRNLLSKVSFLLASVLLIAVAAFAFVFKSTRQECELAAFAVVVPATNEESPGERALWDKAGISEFQPNTEAERELEKMLRGKDEDIDLALANWLIAGDIPEFHDFSREAYVAELSAMTEQVRKDMARMQASGYGGTNPDDPKARCQRFCSGIIGLQFAYTEEFREENLAPAQMKALYADPDNIALAGLLRTRRGSCVSMPLIYLVIGQRLGMPVHLVVLGKHFFIRWEEPGFRVNIETTSVNKIAWSADDSVYLDIEGMTRDRLKGSDLRNLSNREVVGELFFTRVSYWHTKDGKCENQSLRDLARARLLAPDDPVIERTHQAIFKHDNIESEYTSVGVKPKE